MAGDVAAPQPASPLVPAPDRARTVAHLAHTARVAVGHVARHIGEAQAAASPESVRFNLEHAATHIGEAAEHQDKLLGALTRYYPEVAGELGKLGQAVKPGSVVALPPRPEKASYGYDAGVSHRLHQSRRGPEPVPLL